MFAKRLKELRMRKGLTQIQFAEKFNISSGTIAMWETGKRAPDKDTIVRLAQFFDVSTDYLLGNDKEKSSDSTELDSTFFHLKKGLEPYDLDSDDVDFLLTVFKAHKEKNK